MCHCRQQRERRRNSAGAMSRQDLAACRIALQQVSGAVSARPAYLGAVSREYLAAMLRVQVPHLRSPARSRFRFGMALWARRVGGSSTPKKCARSTEPTRTSPKAHRTEAQASARAHTRRFVSFELETRCFDRCTKRTQVTCMPPTLPGREPAPDAHGKEAQPKLLGMDSWTTQRAARPA